MPRLTNREPAQPTRVGLHPIAIDRAITIVMLADGPVIVLVNAASGSGRGAAAVEQAEAVLGALRRPCMRLAAGRGAEVPVLAQRAARLAAIHDGVVVAAGGDGTVSALATALMQLSEERGTAPVPLGILPVGTFNFVARAYGVPDDPADAARSWHRAHARTIQCARVNGRAFLVHAALGLYPRLLEDREAFTRQYGRSRLVALGAALRTLLRPGSTLQLDAEVEGRPLHVETSTLFVGTNRLQLERIGFPEADAVERGELAVLWLRPTTPAQRLWIALRGAVGELAGADAVVHDRVRSISVAPRRRRGSIKVALDGEIALLKPPLHFGLAHWPLRLIVPQPQGEAQPAPAGSTPVAAVLARS